MEAVFVLLYLIGCLLALFLLAWSLMAVAIAVYAQLSGGCVHQALQTFINEGRPP